MSRRLMLWNGYVSASVWSCFWLLTMVPQTSSDTTGQTDRRGISVFLLTFWSPSPQNAGKIIGSLVIWLEKWMFHQHELGFHYPEELKKLVMDSPGNTWAQWWRKICCTDHEMMHGWVWNVECTVALWMTRYVAVATRMDYPANVTQHLCHPNLQTFWRFIRNTISQLRVFFQEIQIRTFPPLREQFSKATIIP